MTVVLSISFVPQEQAKKAMMQSKVSCFFLHYLDNGDDNGSGSAMMMMKICGA